MKYLASGKQITDEEAEELKKHYKEILEEVNRTGDISKLLEIDFIFSKEVNDKIS